MSEHAYMVRLRRYLLGWTWLVVNGAEVRGTGWRITRRRALRAAVARVQLEVATDLGYAPSAWRTREHGTDLTLGELVDLSDQLNPHPKETDR